MVAFLKQTQSDSLQSISHSSSFVMICESYLGLLATLNSQNLTLNWECNKYNQKCETQPYCYYIQSMYKLCTDYYMQFKGHYKMELYCLTFKSG